VISSSQLVIKELPEKEKELVTKELQSNQEEF
jgi:hypothetical protein